MKDITREDFKETMRYVTEQALLITIEQDAEARSDKFSDLCAYVMDVCPELEHDIDLLDCWQLAKSGRLPWAKLPSEEGDDGQ